MQETPTIKPLSSMLRARVRERLLSPSSRQEPTLGYATKAVLLPKIALSHRGTRKSLTSSTTIALREEQRGRRRTLLELARKPSGHPKS